MNIINRGKGNVGRRGGGMSGGWVDDVKKRRPLFEGGERGGRKRWQEIKCVSTQTWRKSLNNGKWRRGGGNEKARPQKKLAQNFRGHN